MDYIDLDMYREWNRIEFPKEYCIGIWNQQDQEVDQEIDGVMNGKIPKRYMATAVRALPSQPLQTTIV
jgi:hypothetical protein